LCAIGSGVIGMTSGKPFLTSRWGTVDWGVIHLKVGTPLLFDLGVYAVVLGVTTTIVFALREE
jgi:multicomponent Na+:H+ antiporter subunit B